MNTRLYIMDGVSVRRFDGFYAIRNAKRGSSQVASFTRSELNRLRFLIDAILEDTPVTDEALHSTDPT